jgi:hypothetical protein
MGSPRAQRTSGVHCRPSCTYATLLCIPLSSDLSPQYLVSPDRKTFLAEFGPGGKYENTVGIYRGNESSEKIGVFDKDLINALPSSLKWIAHNGAGYDPVDVHACKSRGTPFQVEFNSHLMEMFFCSDRHLPLEHASGSKRRDCYYSIVPAACNMSPIHPGRMFPSRTQMETEGN